MNEKFTSILEKMPEYFSSGAFYYACREADIPEKTIKANKPTEFLLTECIRESKKLWKKKNNLKGVYAYISDSVLTEQPIFDAMLAALVRFEEEYIGHLPNEWQKANNREIRTQISEAISKAKKQINQK